MNKSIENTFCPEIQINSFRIFVSKLHVRHSHCMVKTYHAINFLPPRVKNVLVSRKLHVESIEENTPTLLTP